MYYGKNFKVNGLICAMILRKGYAEGRYEMIFERDYCAIEDIESVDWTHIEVEELKGQKSPLPAGYSFNFKKVEYTSYNKSYVVTVETDKKEYGDITGYQEEIDRLTKENSGLDKDLADADALVLELYEQINALEAVGNEQDAEQAEDPEMEV